MSKEAMKLALEALENSWTEPGNKQYEIEKEAITALREALAEQPAQQEPAFYRDKEGVLMTPDQARLFGFDLNYLQALYTSPPAQRTWVGLTDQQIDALRLATGYAAGLERFTVIAQAIEAKLKEKNA